MKVEYIEQIEKFHMSIVSFLNDINKINSKYKEMLNAFLNNMVNKWGNEIKNINNNDSYINSSIGNYMALLIHTLEVANFIDCISNTITKKSINDGIKINGNMQYYIPSLTYINFNDLWSLCGTYEKTIIASRLNELYLYGYPVLDNIGISKFNIIKHVKYHDASKSIDDYRDIAKNYVSENISEKGTKINSIFSELLDLLTEELKKNKIDITKLTENMDICKLGEIMESVSKVAYGKFEKLNLSKKDMEEITEKINISAKKNKEMELCLTILNQLKKK